jgi:hypothetical protein
MGFWEFGSILRLVSMFPHFQAGKGRGLWDKNKRGKDKTLLSVKADSLLLTPSGSVMLLRLFMCRFYQAVRQDEKSSD